MRTEQWLNPHQEKMIQRRQSAEIMRLPILEQAKMLERDAEILAETLEFGHQVKVLLNNFGTADAIPEKALEEAVEGSDYPPGMALALARVLEQQEKKKRKEIH